MQCKYRCEHGPKDWECWLVEKNVWKDITPLKQIPKYCPLEDAEKKEGGKDEN
jgi:hypothetical protein